MTSRTIGRSAEIRLRRPPRNATLRLKGHSAIARPYRIRILDASSYRLTSVHVCAIIAMARSCNRKGPRSPCSVARYAARHEAAAQRLDCRWTITTTYRRDLAEYLLQMQRRLISSATFAEATAGDR